MGLFLLSRILKVRGDLPDPYDRGWGSIVRCSEGGVLDSLANNWCGTCGAAIGGGAVYSVCAFL